MKPLLVRYSRWYFIAQPLMLLAFVSGSFQLLAKRSITEDYIGGTLFGLMVVLTGWGLVGIIQRKPRVVLNDNGLFVASLAVGTIPWPEIEQVFMHEIGWWKGGVELLLRNPELYLARRSRWQRLIAFLRVMLGEPPFGFQTKGFDASAETIVANIKQRLNQ